YVYTDEAIQNSVEFPTVAIESGFEKNPQMIMWDPATYPDVKTIADVGKEGILVRYFGGAAYMEYFLAEGILSNDQVDGSYDGTPALFIADQGASAQQGFGSAEPYIYANDVADWMKPVSYAYINDAGWENYAESIATKPENVTKYADCFTKLVPMIQQSSVDYLADPAAANAIVLDAVAKFDNGWVYTQGVADYGVATIKGDGLVANGPDSTVGNFDLDRVNALIAKAIPVYTALGQPPKDGLKAEDIVTNQFIDESIGL
ncbi:MAG: ABC transporter substrate-binding protein, partial [Actinomycetota bacterium]